MQYLQKTNSQHYTLKEAHIIYNQMLLLYKNIEKQINNIENQLETLPSGRLSCAGNGNHYKWYHCDGHTNTYIPKKNRVLAEQLALKKYLTLLLEDLTHEQRAIQFYLSHHADTQKATLLLENPEYQTLLTPYFSPLSKELSDWMNSTYEQNPKHPELLLHKSTSGNILRSKSEAMIDMCLYQNKIPFRYECALHLGNITIFPDFTIRHPKTGATYYWEHFGLMDNSDYSQNVCQKLQLYTSNGIVPSIQLITTYETKENPLSINTVAKIVSHYFE